MVTSSTVLRIFESGVVSSLDAITFGEDTLTDKVEILNLCGKPWHSFWANLGDFNTSVALDLGEALLDVGVLEVSHKVDMEAHGFLLVWGVFGGLGLNEGHVYVVGGQAWKNMAELTWFVVYCDEATCTVLSFPKLKGFSATWGWVHAAHSSEGSDSNGVEVDDARSSK